MNSEITVHLSENENGWDGSCQACGAVPGKRVMISVRSTTLRLCKGCSVVLSNRLGNFHDGLFTYPETDVYLPVDAIKPSRVKGYVLVRTTVLNKLFRFVLGDLWYSWFQWVVATREVTVTEEEGLEAFTNFMDAKYEAYKSLCLVD